MATVLLILVVVLVLAALVFGVVSLLSGDDPGLGAAEPDGRAVPLPNDRSLTETDLKSVRFDVGWRGYRMAQVDRVLRRTAYDIGYKDEMIAVLEAEVIALRDGRAEDAELLRKARESAANPQVAPATSATPPGSGSAGDAAWSDGPTVLGDEPLDRPAQSEQPVIQRPAETRAPVVPTLGTDGAAALRASATVEAPTTPAEAVTPAAEDGDDRPEGSLAYKPVRRVQLAEELPGSEVSGAELTEPSEQADPLPADNAPTPAHDNPAPTGNASASTGNASAPAGNASAPTSDASAPASDASAPASDASVRPGDAEAAEAAGPARRSPAAKKSARPTSGRSPRGR